MVPQFHSYVQLLVPQINKHVDKLVRRIDARADGKTPIDIAVEFETTGLDIISEVATRHISVYTLWSVLIFKQLIGSTDALGLMKPSPDLKGKDVADLVHCVRDCFEAAQLSLYPHSFVYQVCS